MNQTNFDIIELDKDYSTTKRVIKADPKEIESLVKQSNKPEDKFETVLFLPEVEGRQGEGGLRTQGYFKAGGVIGENTVIPAKAGISEHNRHSREGGNPSSPETKPLITVVTVVYNGEQFLEETILSVINQTYDNVEYIIIDGGSTDGTLDIIKKYDHAVDYWVSEKDEGISDAFNKGARLALGTVVAVLNADDYYFDSNVLCEVAGAIKKKCMQIIYGKTKKITQTGDLLDKRDNTISWCMSVPFSHCSSFISHAALKQIGLYSKNYKIAMDIDLLFRAKVICSLIRISSVIGVQRDGGISDMHRYKGYREYICAAYPYCGFKAYLYYFFKLAITLKSKIKK